MSTTKIISKGNLPINYSCYYIYVILNKIILINKEDE